MNTKLQCRNKRGQFANEGFNKNGFKKCVICKTIKPALDYSSNKSEHDGINKRCRKCSTIYIRKWRRRNIKRNAEIGKQFYIRHKEILSQKNKSNYLKMKNDPIYKKANQIRVKKWVKDHPEQHLKLMRLHSAKRRASLIHRTPTWVNWKVIKKIYDNCPMGMVVDHIIPLQGKTVSGMHVHQNLQYLTHSENSKKSNKYN